MSCSTLEKHENPAGAPGRKLLVATDFDGTIARIVARPQDAGIEDCARAFLRRCASYSSIAVAILSGRDVDDVRSRLDGIPAIVAGSHGHECVDVDGSHLWATADPVSELDAGLLADLDRAGLFVERKKFSIAVHYRGIESDHIVKPLTRFAQWAGHNGLDLLPGRKVVEARLPGGGKRAALQLIAGYVGAGRVVYAGDDSTDFGALALAADLGRAIFVRSSERAVPDVEPLQVVATVEDLCRALAQDADKWRRPGHSSEATRAEHSRAINDAGGRP